MGLNGSAILIAAMREVVPSAFVEVMTKDEEEKLRKKTKPASKLDHYTIVRKVPDKARCAAVTVDVSSIMYQLLFKAEIGNDVLERLDRLVNGYIELHGAERIVLCMDNKKYVPRCKSIEHGRRYSNGVRPYGDDDSASVTLADGSSLPLAIYEFSLKEAMPDSVERLLRTPVLTKRLKQFIATLVANELQPACPLTVIVCGASFEEQRAGTDSVAPAATSDDDDDDDDGSELATHWVDRTLEVHYAGSNSDRERILRLEQHEAVRIGEAECKCVYWAYRIFDELRGVGSVLVRCNDTDAITTLLLNVPRMLKLGLVVDNKANTNNEQRQQKKRHRRTREVWLDYTAPSTHTRLINVMDLWRGIHAWTAGALPDPLRQHFPVEALLCAVLLGGCDYVTPLGGMGAAHFIAEYMERPATLAANMPDKSSVVMCCSSVRQPLGTDMLVVEGKLYDLLLRALFRNNEIKHILKSVGGQEMRRHRARGGDLLAIGTQYFKQMQWRSDESPFKPRFDKLAELCRDYNVHVEKLRAEARTFNASLTPGTKRRSEPRLAPRVPPFDGVRALVRRVLWTLDYYRNALFPDPAPPHHTDPLATVRGVSLYGYSRNNDNGSVYEAMHVVDEQTLDQPFRYRVRGDLYSDAERRRELLTSSAAARLASSSSNSGGRVRSGADKDGIPHSAPQQSSSASAARKRKFEEEADGSGEEEEDAIDVYAKMEAMHSRSGRAFGGPNFDDMVACIEDPNGSFIDKPELLSRVIDMRKSM